MKTIKRNAVWAACLLFAVTSLMGCATRTRLGDLIPAHNLSDQRNGEEVWVDMSSAGNFGTNNLVKESVKSPALLAPLAAAAVGVFIDSVKGQMQSEAARYDAGFHNVAFGDTYTLFTKEKATVLLTRWVDRSPPRNDNNYKKTLDLVYAIVMNPTASSHSKETEVEWKNRVDNKSLAFAYCVELDRAPIDMKSPPFLIKPQWKWQWLSKAKVVSFHTGKFYSWPAGLLMKTGSEVEYEVDFTLSALVMTTNGYPQTTTIGLKEPILANARFDLSGTKQFQDYRSSGPQNSGWVVVPGYPTLQDYGYFGIGLSVKESDPSNVKTMLLQGSQYLENNKQSIVNRVTGGL